MRPGALIRLVRPTHIVKSLFILLPAPFAAAAGESWPALDLFLGFVGFSALASGVYALNDVVDAERDRAHPRKRLRPVASGEVSPRLAGAIGIGAIAGGLLLFGLVAEGRGLPLGAAYLLLNVIYTSWGKHVTGLDVVLLSLGFLIRIALGCRLIDVAPSNWLLLCGATVALLLALGKRRADLTLGVGEEHRPSLGGYSARFLDWAMGVAIVIALIAYALYTTSSPVFLPERRYAGLPFAAFGLLAHLRRALLRHDTRPPVELVLRSPEILLALAGYAVATAWSLGVIDGVE